MLNTDCEKSAAYVYNNCVGELLENYDRKSGKKCLIGTFFIIIGIILFFFPVHKAIVIASIIIGIIFFITTAAGRREFFRNTILPLVIKNVFPTLKYNPGKGLSERKFRSFNLFSSYDRYNSEDQITGTIGATDFTAAEVHIEKKHRNKNGTYYTTVFKGVVFIADFNKNLTARTVVLPDIAERCFGKLIGNFLQKMNFLAGEAVRLENPDFEKLFSVYSTDQIEARYVLTPKMMELLIALRNNQRNDVRLLFEGKHVIVAFPKSSGWLEPPFFGKLANVKSIENIICELLHVLSIVEELDLNTRIWTKQ